jgi:adenosylcobinamide-GDP ribazoletransferase
MNEIKVFFTAIMFYTRIPVPKFTGYSEENLNKATRYFPLVGIIVGAITALLFYLLQFILPKELAVLLSMAASIFITGAFHEDGFADFCDGFGGGYTKEKILEIMKDSRIGTYGTIGLIMMLAIKFLSLTNIETAQIPIVLISAHAFSRVFPILMIYTSSYSRMDATSKTKPIGKKSNLLSLIIAVLFGIGLLFFIHWIAVLIIIIFCNIVFLIFRNYVIRKLGGYTGDVLGAIQQISEICFYLMYIIHFRVLEWISL